MLPFPYLPVNSSMHPPKRFRCLRVGPFISLAFSQKNSPAIVISKVGPTNGLRQLWRLTPPIYNFWLFFLDGSEDAVVCYILHHGVCCVGETNTLAGWDKEMESWPSQFCGPVKLSDRWSRLVNVLPGDSVDAAIDNCVKRGCPYGNDKWIEAITEKLGLQITLRARGRPRKGS